MAKVMVGVRLDPELVAWLDRRVARKGSSSRSQEIGYILAVAAANNPEPETTT